MYMYRRRGASVAAALLISLVGHIGFVLQFYFAALTVSPADQIPDVVEQFLIVPVGMAIAAGVPTPGGVGGGEVGFGALYSMIGYNTAQGVSASLVQRIITWVVGLVGYLVYLRMKPALQPLTTEPAPEVSVAGS
jgi:uncharacterized membrane protein YbhN (UPF0104 family)